MVFDREAHATGKPCDKKLVLDEYNTGLVEEEKETLFEEMVDQIFEYDSYLDRKTWEERMDDKHSWLV